MQDKKIPPHSDEAEASVLGAILIDKDAVIAVAEFLRPEHFYSDANGEIFKAVLGLYEERSPIDLITIADKLKKNKALTKVGGTSYLTDLVDNVPTSSNAEKYGTIIKDLYTKRQLISAAQKISEACFDEGVEAIGALDKAEQAIFSLSQKHLKQVFMPIKDALAESFDRLDELHKRSGGLRGIPSGFKELDNMLAGFQPSNLIILAARPGLGKTAFALNVARAITVNEKIPVGMFSVEMSKEELTDRLLTRQSEIDAWKLKTGKLEEEDFSKFSEAMGVLADAPFYIDDTPGISILEMRTKARRLQVEKGLQLLIVDYLQLVRGRNLENRVQEVSEISMGLKNLARELKIPVIALSQLSRAVEVRGGSKPRLSDLRESGCLSGDTLLLRADTGERISIKQLTEEKKAIPIFSMDSNLKLSKSIMVKAFFSGVKKLYRITLRSGKEIKASANHPFYTIFGWKRLDQLKEGEHLAVAREIPSLEKNLSFSDGKIIVLAHFIGDGCYLKHQPLHYTSGSESNLQAVTKAAKEAFGLTARRVKQENWFHLYFSGDKKSGIKNTMQDWFKELEIFDQRSGNKEIPEFVFKLSLKQLSLFLCHLWATDGNFSQIKKAKGSYAIYYASTSKILVTQVQHLLLRFGIVSKVRITKKVGYKGGFIVDISGRTDQEKFLNSIGVFGKETEINKAIVEIKNVKANPNLDVVPKGIWKYIDEERKIHGLSTREFHQKLNWAYSGTQRYKNGISRERLKHINKLLNNNNLKDLASSDLYWDEILEIKEQGKEEVFDATVDKTHNFLANDIIVHNSIEQDADVVMFLYREDEENLENVTLEIAKHRNGPTGIMRLRFVPTRVSFYPLETKREK